MFFNYVFYNNDNVVPYNMLEVIFAVRVMVPRL